jgi:hypothetical protein
VSGETTIERIRRANPVPDPNLLHQEVEEAERLFSSIVRRRDDMIDFRTKRLSAAPDLPRPSYRRPQLALLAAAVVVASIMVPAVLIGGPDDGGFVDQPEPTLPAVEQPTPASTTPGDAVITPEPVTTAPPTTVPVEEPDLPVFDELLVGGHLVMKTEFFTGPDELPFVVYSYQDADAWLDHGRWDDVGLGILRCHDPACIGFDIVEIAYDQWPIDTWPPIEFNTLLSDGSPVLGGGDAVFLVCSDPSCTTMEPGMVDPPYDPNSIAHSYVLTAENGFPMLYFDFEEDGQPSIWQAVCGDRLCVDVEMNRLVENSWLGSALGIDTTGRLILTYTADEAVVCEDLMCSSGTSAIDPDTLSGIEMLSPGLYPRSSVFDRNTPRLCLDPWCIEKLDVPVEPIPGRGEPAGFVENWTNEDGLPVFLYATFPVDQDQGDPIPVDLIITECADAACASMTSHVVAEPVTGEDVAAGRWWDSDGAFSTWLRDDGVPLIAYGTIDGLHLIRCTDKACTPPG